MNILQQINNSFKNNNKIFNQIYKINNLNPFNHMYFSTSTKQLNYYEILELRKSCSQKEIKQQFLKLAKTYHPDVYKGSDKDRFKQVKEAYETLRKPTLRKKYDQKLDEERGTARNNYDDFKSEDFDPNDFQKSQDSKRPGDFSFDGMKTNKEKIDLQEEYQKFFEEPVKIQPEEVVVHEDVYERQLGFEERVRYEYSFIRNNLDLYNLKHVHQQGYEETVNDTISMMNAKNIPDAVLKAKDEQETKKWDRYKKIIFGLFLIVSIPFFISHTQRKKLIKEHLDKDSKEYLEQEEQRDLYDLHDRIKFEHRHEELNNQQN